MRILLGARWHRCRRTPTFASLRPWMWMLHRAESREQRRHGAETAAGLCSISPHGSTSALESDEVLARGVRARRLVLRSSDDEDEGGAKELDGGGDSDGSADSESQRGVVPKAATLQDQT